MSESKMALRHFLKNDENLIILLVISVFTHYILTGAMMLIFAGIFLARKSSRQSILAVKRGYVGYAFCALTAIVALVCKNYVGALCSLATFLIFIIGIHAHNVITKRGYESILNICCICGALTSVIVIIEKVITLNWANYYCKAGFFNSNYLATILSTIVIICAYKVITRQGNMLYYYCVAVLSAVGMYLSGSMFIWVELLIGISVLLSLTRRHNLLSIFLILVAFACAIVYFVPEIFPRFSQSGQTTYNRILIWEFSLHSLKKSLFFGHGFLSYMHLIKGVPGAYFTTHAHNIILEPFLSFGIIGTLLLLAFFALYYHKLLICKSFLRHSHINALILALTAAVMVHGLIDMTMLWIQTGLLYAVIMSGIGAEEKLLSEFRKKAKIRKETEHAFAQKES